MASDSIGIPPLPTETEPVGRLRPVRPKEKDERPQSDTGERDTRERDGAEASDPEQERDQRPLRGKHLDIIV